LFEIIPGLSSWTILIGLVLLSFLKPVWAAVFVIAFYLFWLFKLFYMTIFLVLSFYRLWTEKSTAWTERIKGIDGLEHYMNDLERLKWGRDIGDRLSLHVHKQELQKLKQSNHLPPPSKDIFHLVILPVIKESRDIVEPGILSISQQEFPADQIIVLFALEERADDEIKNAIFELEKKYKGRFLNISTVIHPGNLPNEARVKGANVTYAAKKAAKYLKGRNIPYENVIVSCFDADTVVNDNYFSALTYYFMVTPQRLRSSFQPIPVYHNNIWDVPGFARVMETGSSFFQLIEATNPERLVTFSSHSMSFKALVEVDYWPADMISDDSAIYWKSYIHFDGNYQVIPMYVTLSMDVAGSDNLLDTMRTVYKQKRRWAWGVENFPIMGRAFLKADQIPIYDRARHLFKLFEGHISWATWGFLLTFIGWLPALFAQKEFVHSVVYYNAPRITGTIFNLASLSLFISIILSVRLLPKKKTKHSFLKKCKHALEWLSMPLIVVFFSALPALDAQTRLMLGKYMEFWVTVKTRKK
jgi:hypothetical protein